MDYADDGSCHYVYKKGYKSLCHYVSQEGNEVAALVGLASKIVSGWRRPLRLFPIL